MADENALTAATDESTFVITRTFDAPRDLVWKAFTEPDRGLDHCGRDLGGRVEPRSS